MADLDVAVKLRFLALGAEKIKTATRDLTAFGQATRTLSTAATGRLSGDLTRVWTASVKLGGALDKSAGAATRTAMGLGRIGSEAREIDRTRVAVEKLKKSTEGLATAAGRARDARGRVLPQGAREGLAEAASRVAPNGYLVGASAAVAAGAVAGSTAAGAVGVGAYGLKQAIDFEKAMAEVKKKVTLDAGATWADVEKMINRTARAFGLARADVASLTAAAGQAGVAFNDLNRFVELSAKAATAWDMVPREASEKLAKIKAATQWDIEQLAEFANQVNALGDASASAERDIVEMFLRANGAAKAADVPLKTTLAITTALNSIGMQSDVAARFFGAFSSKLRTAGNGQNVEKIAEAFKALGLSVEDVERGMKTDATRTVIDVLKRLEGSADKAKIAIQLFGQEWWDEAARTGQAIPEIVKNLDLLASDRWKNSLEQNLGIELDTTYKRLERIKVMATEIGAALMSWALPPINAQLEKIIRSFETMKATGFLAGPDGNAIPKATMQTPVPFSPENRQRFMRRGIDAYEFSHGLQGSAAPPAAGGSIVKLGRELQAQGLRVSEHPAFGGVHPVHHGRGHYEGRAIDVNVGAGVNEASSPAAGAKFDALAAGLRARGYRVIWRAPGHYDHMHVETPAGFGRGLLRRRAEEPAAPAPAAPGKQSRVGAPTFHIGQLHLHGVNDPAKLHRQLAALSDRHIRRARDGALHDIA